MTKSIGGGFWNLWGSPFGGREGSSTPWNWWQMDLAPPSGADFERFGPVYACVAILAQEISRMPIEHWLINPDQSRTRQDQKAPHRIFRKPNRIQTRSDFMLFLMRSLLLDGNFYAVAQRNDRGEVSALWPVNPRMIWPYIEPESGEIFYRHGSDPMGDIAGWEEDQWFPYRDVLHIRLFTPRHPLVGETPLVAAVYPTLAGTEINKRTAHFFHNSSRPSGILRHPKQLEEAAMKRIKDRFMQLTRSTHTGEPVVLQEGMEWQPMDMSAVDAELIKSYGLSERQVAQIFRVPGFLLGDLEKASFQNVESLTRFFIQSGLGFYVDHIEDAFTAFFALPPNEHILFNVEEAFLRADLRERAESYAKLAQSGIAAPNELRRRENLPPVEFGDEPRVQQQLVPLSYGVNLQPPGNAPPAKEEPTEEQRMVAEIIARKAIEKAMSA
jgi:HK97 family phage portal protein